MCSTPAYFTNTLGLVSATETSNGHKSGGGLSDGPNVTALGAVACEGQAWHTGGTAGPAGGSLIGAGKLARRPGLIFSPSGLSRLAWFHPSLPAGFHQNVRTSLLRHCQAGAPCCDASPPSELFALLPSSEDSFPAVSTPSSWPVTRGGHSSYHLGFIALNFLS